MLDFQYGGLLGILIFVLDIYAIYRTWISTSETIAKIIWTLVILFLPVIGLIAWALFGPKDRGGTALRRY